jgi:hypothetical protein
VCGSFSALRVVDLTERDVLIMKMIDDEDGRVTHSIITKDDSNAIEICCHDFDEQRRTVFVVHTQECSVFFIDFKWTRHDLIVVIANTHQTFFDEAGPERYQLSTSIGRDSDERHRSRTCSTSIDCQPTICLSVLISLMSNGICR